MIEVEPLRFVDPWKPLEEQEPRRETPAERQARVARQRVGRSHDFLDRLAAQDRSIAELMELARQCGAIEQQRFLIADEDAFAEAVLGGSM